MKYLKLGLSLRNKIKKNKLFLYFLILYYFILKFFSNFPCFLHTSFILRINIIKKPQLENDPLKSKINVKRAVIVIIYFTQITFLYY